MEKLSNNQKPHIIVYADKFKKELGRTNIVIQGNGQINQLLNAICSQWRELTEKMPGLDAVSIITKSGDKRGFVSSDYIGLENPDDKHLNSADTSSDL